ncbi:MAG: DUF542 domain-containing protein, partial [Ferruginibacter sp.]
MTDITEQTLASLVINHQQYVPVLEKHDLDYCCKGKRTLSVACLEKGLPVADIVHELQGQDADEKELHMPFVDMNA